MAKFQSSTTNTSHNEMCRCPSFKSKTAYQIFNWRFLKPYIHCHVFGTSCFNGKKTTQISQGHVLFLVGTIGELCDLVHLGTSPSSSLQISNWTFFMEGWMNLKVVVLNISYFHPAGRMIQIDSYFSNGLKPPTRPVFLLGCIGPQNDARLLRGKSDTARAN